MTTTDHVRAQELATYRHGSRRPVTTTDRVEMLRAEGRRLLSGLPRRRDVCFPNTSEEEIRVQGGAR